MEAIQALEEGGCWMQRTVGQVFDESPQSTSDFREAQFGHLDTSLTRVVHGRCAGAIGSLCGRNSFVGQVFDESLQPTLDQIFSEWL